MGTCPEHYLKQLQKCHCVMQDDLYGDHYRDEHHLMQQQNLISVMQDD